MSSLPSRTLLTLSALGAFAALSLQCATSTTEPEPDLTGTGGRNDSSMGTGGSAGSDAGSGGDPNSGDGGGTSSGGNQATGVCEDGELTCAGECTVVDSDMHCGACFRSCEEDSVCEESGAGSFACACDAPKIECGAGCIDPSTNAKHCGASGDCAGVSAGNDCGPGGACVGGNCECGTDFTECDGKCVDNQTDPEYCGTSPDVCGTQCKDGSLCASGTCICPTSPATVTDCNDGCFDVASDPNACGGCPESGGKVCDTSKGQVCRSGNSGPDCLCPLGWDLCDDGTCINPDTDILNCGGCAFNNKSDPDLGSVCGGATDQCAAGQCVSGPCDEKIAPKCAGLSAGLRDENSAGCSSGDDYDPTGLKCDNNSNKIPQGEAVCYEIEGSYQDLRCWWSGRSLEVNGEVMTCNNAGTSFNTLPAAQAGGYCVYFQPSTGDGADTDGFALGNF